ncbi:PAS domain S-box protein, partial [Halopenitus sp. H-Gu1]|uniref:PAS domain-containing protein n=1 Tax=Halopenitus sp. H-Gu1 TaxID=3242697 RepID=UPI00359EB846
DGEIWKEEITNVKQSGERYHAEQTIAPIRDADGIVERFVAIQRDITERKERQSELERYKQLWTNLPVGVGRLDPNEDHRFLQVNERFVEITDAHSEEALLDHPFAELWRDENELGSFLEEVSEGELATTTAQLETLDEQLIWGRITAFCTETPEGHVVDFVLQDVTESRESRIHLETAQGVANIGWWQKDISSDKTYWSDQIAEMWGAKDEGGLIDHDTFLSFIHPDDREYVNEKWKAAKEGEPYDISHRIITSDGGVRWMREKAEFTFDDSGDPVRAIGVVQDITERKAREQRLKEKKEEYEAVIENVHDGLVIIQDDVIQFVNSRITELVGYSPDELIGEPMTDFIVEEYHTTVAERHQQRLASDEELKTYEIEIRRRDGDTLPVELSVGLFDYGGRPATITAIRDVSDRTDRTQQLRVLDRVLRHNLRNAMATIQGYAETIRSEVDDMADETEMILKTSRRLMETIQKEREIVDVIAERPEREEVEVVGDVCQPVVADVRDDYPEAAIEFNHPEEASAIAIGTLERAIEELLENAIIHNDQETPDVTLTVEPHGETVRVAIADTGPRIPEEEANVLTREYDVEPLYHGSGLGLWLVNWIVEQSGGTLTFEENDPRGNIITIELQRPTW